MANGKQKDNVTPYYLLHSHHITVGRSLLLKSNVEVFN